MRDEALGVAEVVRDLDEAQRVLEAEGAGLAALDLEGDHLAAARHLPLGECGLRMVGAAGVEDARRRPGWPAR